MFQVFTHQQDYDIRPDTSETLADEAASQMANPNTTTRAVRGASNAMTPSRSFRAEAQVFTPAARSRVDDIDGEYYPLEVDTFMPGSPPETPFLRPSQLHTSTETTPRGPVCRGTITFKLQRIMSADLRHLRRQLPLLSIHQRIL